MLDFLISGLKNKTTKDSLDASVYQSNRLQPLPISIKELYVDNFLITLFNSKENKDFYLNEDIFVLIYGKCYTKIFNQFLSKKEKLFAEEISGYYQEWGKDFVNYIKGSFVIALLDRKQSKMYVFTDQLNLKSAYYTIYNDHIFISSSLGNIIEKLTLYGKKVEVDQVSLLSFYLFDFILDERTFLKEIKEMLPGTRLQIYENNIKSESYFNSFSYFDTGGAVLDRKEGFIQLKQILTDNINLYNEGPDATEIALTGGFDSRTILALLSEDLKKYHFYSYGKEGSWDITIPQAISKKLKLNYTPIFLDTEDYHQKFSQYADLAVLLSDGTAEFSHANIAYANAEYLKHNSSILTGLFGSELIKTPSNRGLFIDENIIRLLDSSSPINTLKQILFENKEGISDLQLDEYCDELSDMILNQKYICNNLPQNEKYFHYLLMVGMRKYFSKEIKIQKAWKDNLHPFFDIEFIEILLKTPYPWIYHFSKEKSLIKNISIHQLYGNLIHNNPVLSNIISTHGYRPRYVIKKQYYPLLAIDYLLHKKKIKKTTQLDFQQKMALEHIEKNKKYLFGDTIVGENIYKMRSIDRKSYIKLSSLQYWLKSHNLSLSSKPSKELTTHKILSE
ncbi:MAG: hypothetical protein IPJ74_20795 [Saprospiraceae bacterium]|nr:hypothetical protein [Saprospiraceae bacterium]